jgi:hypothetical protein
VNRWRERVGRSATGRGAYTTAGAPRGAAAAPHTWQNAAAGPSGVPQLERRVMVEPSSCRHGPASVPGDQV